MGTTAHYAVGTGKYRAMLPIKSILVSQYDKVKCPLCKGRGDDCGFCDGEGEVYRGAADSFDPGEYS